MNRLEESAFSFHLVLIYWSMASAAGNTNSSKKRHTFFSNFLSSKNLSIFRNKTSTNNHHTINASKESQHYKSQFNLNTQPETTPVPMCIGRGWLKKRLKRPISLDLDLVKTFTHETTSTNNNGQIPADEYQQSLNDMGTIMDRSSAFVYLSFHRKRISSR